MEIDSVNLLRGRITAHIRIYDRQSAQPDKPCYETEVSIVFPEQGPLPMSDSARMGIEQQTLVLFAEELARKFYKHKVDSE